MKYYRDKLELEIDSKCKVFTTSEGHVVESYKVKGKRGYFVTLSGSHWCAHGSTIAEAVSDALWKDPKRRPSLEQVRDDIVAAGESRKITLSEFRLLTGACSEGCRLALEKAGLDGSPMTAKEIVKHFPDWGSKLVEILGDKE